MDGEPPFDAKPSDSAVGFGAVNAGYVLNVMLRSLDPARLPPLGDVYPWPPERRWLRGLMVTTLDGGFRGSDGLSGSISGAVDQHVVGEVRRFADAVMVGAGTIRAENYRPLVPGPDREERLRAGKLPAPVLVVVSASLDLPWNKSVFQESSGTPIVATAGGNGHLHARVQHGCEVIAMPGDEIDLVLLLTELATRGLKHIDCEGGPHLLANLSRLGLVDEVDLTLAPLQTAGGQMLTGDPVAKPDPLTLTSVLECEGWLFTRYVRGGA